MGLRLVANETVYIASLLAASVFSARVEPACFLMDGALRRCARMYVEVQPGNSISSTLAYTTRPRGRITIRHRVDELAVIARVILKIEVRLSISGRRRNRMSRRSFH